ncbi:GGDEF domain-containing protein [Deinococcus pimensis]|uniref:GGDEF domain-containing protein n=1 Tax=Deinococcus pimensis TaxID=309888 RepID=UPI00047FB10A|nr:GGDEF domain-containing protein [Deinococcus pimensis]
MTPPSPPSSTPAADAALDVGLTARTLVRVLPVVAVTFGAALLLERATGRVHPFDEVVYPAMGALFLILTLWIGLRPGDRFAVVLVTLTSAAAFFVAKLGVLVLTTDGPLPLGVASSFLWLPAVFSLAYLLPSGRVALRFNLALMLALPLTVGAAVILRPGPVDPDGANAIVQLLLSSATIHVLARASHLRAQRYARAAALAESAEALALTDALTQLPNRRHLDRLLGRAVEEARAQGTSFCLVYLDLDGFKTINDAYGHAAGDAALQDVARRLDDCREDGQVVARLSGDEFVALLPGLDLAGGQEAARRYVDAVRGPVDLDGHAHHLTVSAGLSEYPRHGADAHTLLRHADAAMYRVKRRGRDGLATSGDLQMDSAAAPTRTG